MPNFVKWIYAVIYFVFTLVAGFLSYGCAYSAFSHPAWAVLFVLSFACGLLACFCGYGVYVCVADE